MSELAALDMHMIHISEIIAARPLILFAVALVYCITFRTEPLAEQNLVLHVRVSA